MAPFDLTALGHAGNVLLSVAIGFAFGFILERAGFGDARKLAAQFYFYDQAVLKVMFTAIVVAMLLLFTSVQLGLLDFERVYVNPTYIWPGIIGGVLLGIGFILGGYCPGTSVVSAATLKLDGLFFLLGCLLGIFAFGPTLPLFQSFWEQAGYMGRSTIPEWLGWSNGVVALLVVLMAVGMFAGAEWLEARFRTQAAPAAPASRFKLAGVATLLLLGGSLALLAQVAPDPAATRLRRQAEEQLASRERHIEPPELLSLMQNNQVRLQMFDVRDEADYNLFHLVDSQRVSLSQIQDRTWVKGLPVDSIKVVASNDEESANEAALEWMSQGVRNVYILSGGINHWLEVYGKDEGKPIFSSHSDSLRYVFPSALGANYPAADPDRWHTPQLPFTPKVKFDKPLPKVSGGCGG
jgi:rhodanese-related sulfurtransferase